MTEEIKKVEEELDEIPLKTPVASYTWMVIAIVGLIGFTVAMLATLVKMF